MDRDDANIVARALAGDRAAFEALWSRHAGRVRAYLRRRGFRDHDAEDLTQETFVRVHKSLVTFDPARGDFGGWLAVIARNVARRAAGRRPEPASFDPELAEATFASEGNPGAEAARREELDALAECMEKLSPELGRIVRLRYVEARTTRGVAAAVGAPESTVRLRLAEAKGLLETCLKGKGFMR